MLAVAGLDMGLINVLHPHSMLVTRMCRVLLGGGIFSWADLPELTG
jgi:hypothetical protein